MTTFDICRRTRAGITRPRSAPDAHAADSGRGGCSGYHCGKAGQGRSCDVEKGHVHSAQSLASVLHVLYKFQIVRRAVRNTWAEGVALSLFKTDGMLGHRYGTSLPAAAAA